MESEQVDKDVKKINGQCAAFGQQGLKSIQTGLSKREYFAGFAMQGILANPNATGAEAVLMSIHYADELLKALES